MRDRARRGVDLGVRLGVGGVEKASGTPVSAGDCHSRVLRDECDAQNTWPHWLRGEGGEGGVHVRQRLMMANAVHRSECCAAGAPRASGLLFATGEEAGATGDPRRRRGGGGEAYRQ